jgi:hypothetical protein
MFVHIVAGNESILAVQMLSPITPSSVDSCDLWAHRLGKLDLLDQLLVIGKLIRSDALRDDRFGHYRNSM